MTVPVPAPLAAHEGRGFWSMLRAALRGAEFDYTRIGLTRAVWLLAIPMVLEMVMESTFAVVDMFFVAKLGDAAVAAVGLTESMLTIVYAIGLGLAMSTTAMVARRVGEGDLPGAARAGAQAIALVVLLGVALGVPCIALAPWLLAQMGASPAAVELGTGYARWVLGAQVVVMLLFVHNAIFRGAGDAMVAMKALWLANVLNCLLDPLFIFGLGPIPALGVTGAGVATVCGRAAGVAYQIWALRRGATRIRLPRLLQFDWPAMGTLLRLSAFGIGQFLITTISWVALNRVTARFGDATVAGYTIGVRILIFTYLPAWGLSNAVATLVGQNLGAQKPARAQHAVGLVMAYNVAFMTLVGVGLWVWAAPLVAIFVDRPGVVEVAEQCLRVFAYGYPMYAIGMVLVQALNGAGDTRTPTWINVIAYWGIQVPLAVALAVGLDWRADGVFWSVVIGESCMAILAALWFRTGRWKAQRV